MSKWKTKKPTKTGWYWIKTSSHNVRIIHVWKTMLSNEFYTNEDGGASIEDEELYSGALWYGPIQPPKLKAS